MRGPTGKGFTLIEVLVVVAIIALLVAILLPSLARARDMSKRSMCGSQLHQLGAVWTMYAQDHKGWFPALDEFGGAGFGNWTLITPELRDMFDKRKYGVKGGLAFYCPTYEPRRGPSAADDWKTPRYLSPPNGDPVYNISYTIYAAQPQAIDHNKNLQSVAEATGVSRPDIPPPIRDNEKRLQDRPLLFDEVPYYVPGGTYDATDDFGGALHAARDRSPTGGNSVHGDGHVEWHKFRSVLNGDPNQMDYEYVPGFMITMMNIPDTFTRFY